MILAVNSTESLSKAQLNNSNKKIAFFKSNQTNRPMIRKRARIAKKYEIIKLFSTY